MENKTVSIQNGIDLYVDSLQERAAEQTELRNFERWIGKTKSLGSLKPLDIEHYAERFSPSDPDYNRKIGSVKKFLVFARDKGWTSTNLSVHLKVIKAKTKSTGMRRSVKPELAVLTLQGYDDVVKEIGELKAMRPHVLEEIRRAAADKDFRENAPLHAAREQMGHIDGRIQELSLIIKSANIIGENEEEKGRVAVGNTVALVDVGSGQTVRYTIVGPKEANPAQGKISHVSPLGKAMLGKTKGDLVEVAIPAGTHHYRVEEISK